MFKEKYIEYRKGILHEDMEMLPRVFFAAQTVSFLNEEFYHYVIRGDSVMGSANRQKNGKHITCDKRVKFEDYSEIHGLCSDGLVFGNDVTIGR